MFDDFSSGPYGTGNPNRPEAEGVPEAQRILQGLLAELPDEAQTLVDKIERELARIQEQAAAETTQIREQAEGQVAEVENKAENRRKGLLQHAMDQLEPLQKNLFRAGELGKALATFVQIQALKARAMPVLPDPGNLVRFEQVGKSFYFRVTGHHQGAVWGTDLYTSDSHLGTAAVHAGALEAGEEGVVKATLVGLAGVAIRGSMRNGVMTMDWGPYPVGYRIRRAE